MGLLPKGVGGWGFDLRESRHRKVMGMINQQRKGRLLDLGCSTADFTSQLIKGGWVVYGMDRSRKHIERAKKKGIRGIVADFTKRFPYKQRSFDVVYAGEVIEHCVDTTKFIKECGRVLKPNGLFIVTTPNLASLENRARLLFGFYPAWMNYSVAPPYHFRSYTLSTLRNHLKECGFEVRRIVGNFVPLLPEPLSNDCNRFLCWLGNFFPNLSQGMILMAHKCGVRV